MNSISFVLPLALRCVLGYGSVRKIKDQSYGAVLADSERLISDEKFKEYQKQTGNPMELFLTGLYYYKYSQDKKSDEHFKEVQSFPIRKMPSQSNDVF